MYIIPGNRNLQLWEMSQFHKFMTLVYHKVDYTTLYHFIGFHLFFY